MTRIDIGLALRPAFFSDETYEAIRADIADGLEVRSLTITGDVAIVDTLEVSEIELRREDGRWWVLEDDDPCEEIGS